MDIDTAPSAHDDQTDDDEDVECDVCGKTNSYVYYEGDKMCKSCGHVSDGSEGVSSASNPWGQWWEHRAAEYSGFYGPDRIKFVGGFAAAYP